MTPHAFAGIVSIVGLLAAVAGLLYLRRWRVCIAFTAYALAVAASDLMILCWPEKFWTREFWHQKQAVIELAKLGVFLELGLRITHGLARARQTLAQALAAVAALATIAPGSPWDPSHHSLPLLLVALSVLYVRARYSLPMHPLALRILLGHVLYLGAYGVVFRYFPSPYIFALMPTAYVSTVCYWAFVSWRPHTAEKPYLEARRRILAWA